MKLGIYKSRNKPIIRIIVVIIIAVTAVILYSIQKKVELGDLFAGLALVVSIGMLFTQSTIMIQQQMENTFFLLLGQWRDIVKNIEFGQNWFRGSSVLKDLYKRFDEFYRMKQKQSHSIAPDIVFDSFKEVDEEEYQLLENYFFYFIQLLDYINRKNWLVWSVPMKKAYASILVAQLSTYEQKMILCRYFIGRNNKNSIQNLICEYGILDQCVNNYKSRLDETEEDSSMIYNAITAYLNHKKKNKNKIDKMEFVQYYNRYIITVIN